MTSELFLSIANVRLPRSGEPAAHERGATKPYVIHQLVADLFGQFDKRPYLYRVDDHQNGADKILILSRRRPGDSAVLPARRYGAVDGLRTKSFRVDVPAGTLLDFEIRLNATKDIPEEEGPSRRLDVWDATWREDKGTEQTPHDVYREYLKRRLVGAAEVVEARVTERGLVRAKRHLRHRPITFVATNVIGTVRVQECGTLNRIVGQGLGRSRAFGCGMLCLSRPGTVLPRRHPMLAEELY